MAIAAIPEYLNHQDLSAASPGMRFGMYLPVWGRDNRTKEILWGTHDINYRIAGRDHQERRFEDNNKVASLKQALKLNRSDTEIMEALTTRQTTAAASMATTGQLLSLNAKAIAPFTTGLGNEHPLENGFAFLNPYGLPYLPGSGVKGVLRQAARELLKGDWGDACDWNEDAINALFGKEDSNSPQRGTLSFWDVIPQLKGNTLQVEVMTAHQGHYYQQGESPHDSGQPIPINFLTIPPGSGFTFHVQCNRPFLSRLAPRLAADDRWRDLLQVAFTHAFDWLGFGAKTAVGYGHMQIDEQRTEQIRQEQEEEEREQARQKELESALDGLPEDAAWIETQSHSGDWQDNNRLLGDLEAFLDGHENLSQEALRRLRTILDQHWKGIIENPDATHGKKNKPSFKPRPRELARRLIAMLGKA